MATEKGASPPNAAEDTELLFAPLIVKPDQVFLIAAWEEPREQMLFF